MVRKEDRCKVDVQNPGSVTFHRCYNKATRDGYCGIHHPDAVERRRKKSDEAYEIKRMQSPYFKLQKAKDRIAKLEEQLAHKDRVIEMLAGGLKLDVPFLSAGSGREGVIEWAEAKAKWSK